MTFFLNFRYSLLCLFRNYGLIFWTFIFPVILGAFFFMAFSGIEDASKQKTIDVAVVQNEDFRNNAAFKKAFEDLSAKDDDNRLFNTTYTDKEKAAELLEKKEITGYLELSNDVAKVTVAGNGIDETILKSAVDEILQSSDIIYRKIFINGGDPEQLEYIPDIEYSTETDFSYINDVSGENMSYTMIEFYTLIAMSCLYGGTIGAVAVNKNLANMTKSGRRISSSPAGKGTLILSSALAAYITQITGVAILLIFTIFVFRVDFGNNLLRVIGISLTGSLAGLTFGGAVAALLKVGENLKIGIVSALTMLGCFMSGMMGISMKYIIDKNIPVLNKINPAAMITDGLYSIYYYDTPHRFYFNIISLLIFSGVMIIISLISIRKQRYDSI